LAELAVGVCELVDFLSYKGERVILADHKLQGTDRYSIDAEARNSKWRITFSWENEEMKDVELVKIEDTH
jgi:plasmid maintenance system killer protein